MSLPILASKLYIPLSRVGNVPRDRLKVKISDGLKSGRKLTLISAPAGFGKTTLVSEWIAGCGLPVAWLSLDAEDHDLTRFLTYFIAALQTITENIGQGTLSALHSPQPPTTDSILTSFLNEIATIPDHFVIVLDDYHLLDAKLVDEALAFVLDHLPPQMHFVITTREDPNLPLARLRARGQLTELRAADLRFTSAEAAEFLNQVMSLHLSSQDIAALETRTEGWIAGLQLAALSMQGRVDIANFIQAFTGSHRFVLDYLVEEVLQHQPEAVRNFLLQTAILNSLCGSLCDAVTGQVGSKGILDILERGNLFLISLDDQRQWYRYHHLFGEVLLAHTLDELPDQVPLLHRRASDWYEQNCQPGEAIRHALAAKDFERAADMIEKTYMEMDAIFQSAVWLGWARKLPGEVIAARPVLCVDLSRALSDIGDFEASMSWLQNAEKLIESPAGELVVADEEQFHSLPAMIALARSYHAQAQGDIDAIVMYAERALALSPEEDHSLHIHAMAVVTLGMAYWSRGDLVRAERALTVWIAYCQKVGNIFFATATGSYLAEIIAAQGRLNEAENILKQTITLATPPEKVRHIVANLYLGLGMLNYERGDLQSAEKQMQISREMGEQALVDFPYRWRLAQARLKEAEGDLEAALDLLRTARQLYVRSTVPEFKPVDAMIVRVYLRQCRLNEAVAWVHDRGLSENDELTYLREFEHITLGRVLISQHLNNPQAGTISKAIGLLERLLLAAETVGRNGSVIEILILQSLALQAFGNLSGAIASLERALTLAEPEGYVRIFVDEGVPMADLLTMVLDSCRSNLMEKYIHKLLAAFGLKENHNSSIIKQGLVEPLSDRELEVLRLLRSELTGPEIAQHLIVSLNTFRTHTKNIFAKLGVNDRRSAIRRAEELGLL